MRIYLGALSENDIDRVKKFTVIEAEDLRRAADLASNILEVEVGAVRLIEINNLRDLDHLLSVLGVKL